MNSENPISRGGSDLPQKNLYGNISKRLAKDIRELSALAPGRGIFHIAIEWLMILAAIHLCRSHWSPFLYAATVVWIGARQHALLILMHDGAHYRLCRNRTLNDWLSEIFLAWPALISARSYRINHFAHHRYLNTDRDPDWVRKQGDQAWEFPKQPRTLFLVLMKDLTGLGTIALFRLMAKFGAPEDESGRPFRVARQVYYLALAGLFVWFGLTKVVLLYWFVPLLTWLALILRVRSIAEHFGIEAPSAFGKTRTTLPSALERVLVAPKNVNYHLEHHLYPSVPFYRLPKLYALLKTLPEYQEAHITSTYLGVLQECVSKAGSAPKVGVMFDRPAVGGGITA
jgi:fatty acid desaturase